VKIGDQWWMAQSLNYRNTVGATDTVGVCYNFSSDSCANYGRLYQWTEVMGLDNSYLTTFWGGPLPHQGICPSAWHVPSDSEWTALSNYLGGEDTAGTKLKSTSGWSVSGNTDAYGFRGRPAGILDYNGSFNLGGSDVYFWSSSENDARRPWFRGLDLGNNSLNRYYYFKNGGFSVRCIAN
jgi:uncharacterized protein (TIGR02145 family)